MRTIDVSGAGRVSHSQVYQEFTKNINGQDDLTIITRTVHTTRDENPEPLRTDRYGLRFTKIEGQSAYKVVAVWERTTPDETTPWVDIWVNEVENFGRERTGDPLTDKYLSALEPITSTTVEAHKFPGHYAYHWAKQLEPILAYLDTPATHERY